MFVDQSGNLPLTSVMATKRTCTDSGDLSEGREKLKSSKTGSSMRPTRDPFSPRRFVGRNDMVVDLNLGKVVIPKEEVGWVIKEEKISEELENDTDHTSAVEDEEGNVEVKVVGEEVDILDNFEADEGTKSCPCACWNKIQSLEAIVEEQGRQIHTLNNVVMGLLGRQMASKQVQRPPGKESGVDPVLGESQPTQAGEIEIRKGRGKRPERAIERLVSISQLHQRQPEIPSAEIPVLSGEEFKTEGSASSANSRKESCRPPPPLIPLSSGTGNHGNTETTETTAYGGSGHAGASGEKHACPHCAKEGRHRLFSSHDNLRRHVRETHSVQKKLHKCDTCSKTYTRKEYLDQHIRIVHEGVRYKCGHCTGSYVDRRSLIEHQKIHARGVSLIRCKLCGLDLISDESLKRHLGRCVAGRKRPKQPGTPPPPPKKVCVERTARDCPHCKKRFDCDASLNYHLHEKHGILENGDESSLSDGVKGPLRQD